MRQHASSGFRLSEFAAALAALAVSAFILHPILAQARTNSNKPSAFHSNSAFQMYASDVDGGSGDFEGKPVLIDNLEATLASYGRHAAPRVHRSAKVPMTGCRPFLRFEPSSYVAATGSLTYWEGQVGNASSNCSISSATEDESVLLLPDWDEVPTDSSGNFWLVAGAMQEGIGTIAVETNTGAVAEDSVMVLN